MDRECLFRMNLDLSSMSEFDMCDRIQELIPRMDDQSNFAGFSKNSTMNAIMDPYGFHDQSEECFDCPYNGKICSELMEFAGKSVIQNYDSIIS